MHRTQHYFQQVVEAKWYLDQRPMNEVLLNDPEACWQIHQPSVWSSDTRKIGGKWQKITSLGRLCRLLSPHDYIFISSEIIKGKFSNGLTAGVIPMHLVTRINYQWSNSPFVVHINTNKK